ncbi:hypothetical protein NDU88_003699 [Pleurodeles waltl]|uniref:Reverse transcriptase domain-containing protein n=1 Tax=Pleurodeles waltl TaxID=8319 RepID=A0AAV7WPT9_PLEWA|nr:hypothetical protein NDU88_003699 [Pleurodeles waltl]
MYRDECNRLLGNTRHYKRLSRDPTIDVQEEITFLVSKGKENNWITDHEASYLIQTNPKIPYFYILPKVHKGKIPPPGRPIVSGIGSALEPLSKFVDFFLQPIVKRIPTYLKDTTHVLLLLESIAFDKSKELLITLDVESLYTNITQEATLEVISNLLDVHMGGSQTQTPPGFILDLAHLALTRNYFKFEDSFFLQTQGTSMGSTFAPSLACLYVDHIERHTILHEDNPYRDQIKLWKRYIDDVLLIWTGSKEEAQAFAIWLNGANPFLTFTMNIGSTPNYCRLRMVGLSMGSIVLTLCRNSIGTPARGQKKEKPKRPLPGYDRTLSREDNARGPEIGAELQGYKERKREGLQRGNNSLPLRTALQASDLNA